MLPGLSQLFATKILKKNRGAVSNQKSMNLDYSNLLPPLIIDTNNIFLTTPALHLILSLRS